jgi:hypothetical protein
MKQFLAIFIAAFFLLSCQNQTASKWTKLTLIQEEPVLVHLNLGDTSHSHGDGMAFEAVLKDTTGKAVGEILGWLITANIDYIDSAKMTTLSTRIGTVVFKFDEENEIVAQGSTIYHHGHRQMKPGIPQSRAIVGGTGKYKGVEGQILSTRNDDRTYTHVFDMKLED